MIGRGAMPLTCGYDLRETTFFVCLLGLDLLGIYWLFGVSFRGSRAVVSRALFWGTMLSAWRIGEFSPTTALLRRYAYSGVLTIADSYHCSGYPPMSSRPHSGPSLGLRFLAVIRDIHAANGHVLDGAGHRFVPWRKTLFELC